MFNHIFGWWKKSFNVVELWLDESLTSSRLIGLCLCRRGSSRRSSPSRSGSRCSRPPSRRRWRRRRLPARPSRPAPLRMKTKRTTCECRREVRATRNLLPVDGVGRVNAPGARDFSVTWITHVGTDREDGGGGRQPHVQIPETWWRFGLSGCWCFWLISSSFPPCCPPSQLLLVNSVIFCCEQCVEFWMCCWDTEGGRCLGYVSGLFWW